MYRCKKTHRHISGVIFGEQKYVHGYPQKGVLSDMEENFYFYYIYMYISTVQKNFLW